MGKLKIAVRMSVLIDCCFWLAMLLVVENRASLEVKEESSNVKSEVIEQRRPPVRVSGQWMDGQGYSAGGVYCLDLSYS